MASTTSLSVHFFSDEEDGTFSREYSTLSADNAPPYACDMPFVHLLALHIMRESDNILTGVNYDDLAIATRHNLLQQIVCHDEPQLMCREKTPIPRSWACDPLSSSLFPSFRVPSRLVDTPCRRHLVPIHDTIEGHLNHTTLARRGLR